MKGFLYSLSTIQHYVQSALQKKRLIAFFAEHFNESHASNFSLMILKVKRVVSESLYARQ